jgi:hypothetical protein
MSTRTNENEFGLKKIMDMTRLISVILLLMHFYFSCYAFFKAQGWRHRVGDQVLNNVLRTGIFDNFHKAKLLSLAFLIFSLLGAKAKKGEAFNYQTCTVYILSGLIIYFLSGMIFLISIDITGVTVLYVTTTILGYALFMTGGTQFFRIIRQKLKGEVFNTDNETFPQEERLITNKYSINLPTTYNLKGKVRKGWINIINGFRGGILLMGLPGSGKTLIAKEILKQQIEKGYAMFIHDFKFPDLTKVAYNHYMKNKKNYRVEPEFHIINFEDVHQRCNPLMPASIESITDAASASRAILLGLNQEWIGKQGDFWVESSINFTTALIWYLRLYEDGKYCTLPHVVELAQTPLEKLFAILISEPTLEVLVMPFVRALEGDAGKQLIGQISGASISLGTLATEKLYYVLSGSDFSMNINDPKKPKIVCIANNPQVSNIYSAVISLYLNTLQKLLKEQEEQPCGILLEEFANISWASADKFLSICRSYLVNVTLIIQDASQLIMHYGEKQAKVILSMIGNIISGQVTGESAKNLSERFGKIMQDRQSLTISSADTSINKSMQLDYAIPQSTIASLSAGEVVGVVADNPDQRINHKMFHGQVMINFNDFKNEINYEIPNTIIDQHSLKKNFARIKLECKALVADKIEEIQ